MRGWRLRTGGVRRRDQRQPWRPCQAVQAEGATLVGYMSARRILADVESSHVRLTDADFASLFGAAPPSIVTVTVTNDDSGKGCAVPARSGAARTEARLTFTDCRAMSLEAAVRHPGDLDDLGAPVSLSAGGGSVPCPTTYRVRRHVVISPQLAGALSLAHRELAAMRVSSAKNCLTLHDLLVVVDDESDDAQTDSDIRIVLNSDEASACMLPDADVLDLYTQDAAGVADTLLVSHEVGARQATRASLFAAEQQERPGAVRYGEPSGRVPPRTLGEASVGDGSTDVTVNVSNRHVHLSQVDLETLFGKGHKLTFKAAIGGMPKFLAMKTGYAAVETVTVINPETNEKIENVRVLGPCRDGAFFF